MIQKHTRATKHTLLLTDSNIIINNSNMALTCSDYTTSSSSASEGDGDDSAYDASPMMMSPWIPASPLPIFPTPPPSTLIASLRRNDGHVYSLAAKDGLLYTGSGSKNIRVWNNMQESDAFKSSSGFVKAIVISSDRIFTGHHDGRIRIWKSDGRAAHKQIGTLPTFVEVFKASMRPKNYVKVKRNRKSVWMKHTDAISSMSMDEEEGLLYSSSWDRTFKVWRIKDSKCVESVAAHDDAVNAVVAGGGGVVYTGSADGTVKAWRRDGARHFLWRTLLKQESAVTALAVAAEGAVVYAASSDGLVNFWEVKKEEVAHGGVLKSHKLAVLCLAAAGNLVLSGGADKTIGVWRREGLQHTMLTVLFGHTEPVKCLAVEEGGDGDGGGERKWKVYSGSLDKSVKVWSVSETCTTISSSTHLSKFHHKIW